MQVHPRQLWLKPLTTRLPGALLTGQSGPWHQPWREPKPPTTPGSGPGIPAAFPKSLSVWDLGQPRAQGLSSQLTHPKGPARGDFTLHTQTVRTEPASVAQSLQTDLHSQGRPVAVHHLSQLPHLGDKDPERLGNLSKVTQCPEHSKSSQHCTLCTNP